MQQRSTADIRLSSPKNLIPTRVRVNLWRPVKTSFRAPPEPSIAILALLPLLLAGCAGQSRAPTGRLESRVAEETASLSAAPANAAASAAPPSAGLEKPSACDPLLPDTFERPQHAGAALADVPVEWGERLAPFYEALARLKRGRSAGPLRIGVYGDSNLTQDFLTGEMRRALQIRYGDAGHGFLVGARAWGWYRHQDVQQGNNRWWRVLAVSAPRTPDLGYGISGIAAVCESPGGHTWFATAEEGAPIGSNVEKIDVYFRTQPGGGAFRIQVDGETCDEVSTEGAVAKVGHRTYHMADAPHRIDVETISSGTVRLLGVAFERQRPGIVVDSFGVGGAYLQSFTLDDHELTRDMERKRPHDLLIYWMGANTHHSREYTADLKVLVEERRKVTANLPVLLIGPPDAADKGSNSPSNPMSYAITHQMRKAAEANHSAFWPMRDAQGGEGAGARFLKHGLAVDKQHLSLTGSKLMAHMLLNSLWKSFGEYLAAHPRAGCEAEAERP